MKKKSEADVRNFVRYMLTFSQKHSHPIQVYLHTDTFVPVRWNPKDTDVRKVIYEVPLDKHEQFKRIMRELIDVQNRNIKVSKVADVYCANCGLEYEYRKGNRTGQKICSGCDHTKFIK